MRGWGEGKWKGTTEKVNGSPAKKRHISDSEENQEDGVVVNKPSQGSHKEQETKGSFINRKK